MRVFFNGLFGLVLRASPEEKENSCFLLVNYFANKRKSGFNTFCEEN